MLKLTGSESLLYPCFKEVVDLFKERGHFIAKTSKKKNKIIQEYVLYVGTADRLCEKLTKLKEG